MALIPISPAHQTRWHKTKNFPPSKKDAPRREANKTLFPSRWKSESAFLPSEKKDAFWNFLTPQAEYVGKQTESCPSCNRSHLGRSVAVTGTVRLSSHHRHFGWVVTIHHSPRIHHGPFIIHVLSLRSHPFIYSLCGFSFYKTAIHICSLCELAMGSAVSKVFGKDKREQHEVKRTAFDWAALAFSKTVSK